MNALSRVKKATPPFVVLFALACFAFSPKARASGGPPVVPGGIACIPGWSAGPDLPSPGVRFVGVYFPPNGKFYVMGGRSADTPGNEFMHPFEYDPVTNSWTTDLAATYPDNETNNMACGLLGESGTAYIYCVGGSAGGATTATNRVFRYDPVAHTLAAVPAEAWPGNTGGITLPGGFSVSLNNKLFILGGFSIGVGMVADIWEYTPGLGGSAWVHKTAMLPTALGFIPAATIGTSIYTGGGCTLQLPNTLIDTTNSYKYNWSADSITTIPSIPRATGNTRALNEKGLMWVMGGDLVWPADTNEVDEYFPFQNTWLPGPAFFTARRNFATDNDGMGHIWLVGGYGSDGVTPQSSMEIFCEGVGTPTPTPTATATATATPTATVTVPPRPSPTPRPRPTPAPRP